MNVQIQLPARTITKITVESYVDSPTTKTVEASVALGFADGSSRRRGMTLWTGDEYDAVGQWTETQALERIAELLTP